MADLELRPLVAGDARPADGEMVARRGWGISAISRVLMAGLLASVVSISLSVAFAALIFGVVPGSMPAGMGGVLVGASVLAAVGAARGPVVGTILGPQNTPATVLAAAAAGLATTGATNPGETVLALLIVTSVILGVLLVVLGSLRLGRLVRFVPFPVMAGFMAGVGLALVDGAIGLLRDGRPLDELGSVDALVPLAGGSALAVVVMLAFASPGLGRRLLPWLLLGAVAAVHVGRLLAGISVDAAVARGWLLGPFPSGRLWSPDAVTVLARADWGAMAGQLGTVAVLALLVPMTVLLYTGAVEQEFELDVSADRDLRLAGAGNVLTGLAGGLPGYLQFGNTVLTTRVAAPYPGAGYVVAAASLGAAMVGGPVISLVPVPVVGGVLLFSGLQFIADWLWGVRHRVSRGELAVVVAIAVVTVVLGFLPGIGLGVALAAGLFVLRYSRVRVVRTTLTGRTRRSNVQRPTGDDAILDAEGDRILVLELEGFLFFGSAEGLLEPVRERLTHDEPRLEWLVLDLHRVSGMDASAVAALIKLLRLTGDAEVHVVLSGVDAEIRSRLERLLGRDLGANVELAGDCDRALQRVEDELLAGHGEGSIAAGTSTFNAVFGSAADALRRHFRLEWAPAGTPLLRQGEPGPGLYFLEEGTAAVVVADEAGQELQVRQLRPGTIVGEMSHYLGGPCSASVVLETDARVRFLPVDVLRSLPDVDARAAVVLHEAMAAGIARRLLQSNATVRDLLR